MVEKEISFWAEFPEIRIHDLFDEMYTKDKSKNKQESSRIMKGIRMCVWPKSSMFNVPGKREEIAKKFIKLDKFNWDDYQEYIDKYKEVILSVAEQSLVEWNEIIRTRTAMLKELYKKEMEAEEANIPNLEKLDKMLGNTPKLYADHATIKKEMEEESLLNKDGEHYEDDI